jgi:hypothetical protein
VETSCKRVATVSTYSGGRGSVSVATITMTTMDSLASTSTTPSVGSCSYDRRVRHSTGQVDTIERRKVRAWEFSCLMKTLPDYRAIVILNFVLQ